MPTDLSGRYERIVAELPRRRILIVGDVMLDCRLNGDVSRISPEAPVPVVDLSETNYSPGGAANVAMNVAGLGARATLLGVMGNDEEGHRLSQILMANGIDISGSIIDADRPTSLKTRIFARHQQLVRVDRESREPVAGRIARELAGRVCEALAETDAVLISDYAKGVAVPELLRQVISQARERGKPVVVDPKGLDADKYAGATAVTPNLGEAARLANRDVRDADVPLLAARKLIRELAIDCVLVTRGADGVSLFEAGGEMSHFPAVAQDVRDVTGAGDTVVGVFTLALAAGASRKDCAFLANCAAGVAVGKYGAASVTSEELVKTLVSLGERPPGILDGAPIQSSLAMSSVERMPALAS